MRVLSLIASSTETVAALGCEHLLVGRSHECDYPLSVRALPQCTEPKFVADGTSYEIDQRVKAILQEGLSVYRVFAPALRELKPDVILTQTQCEVCAVSLRDVEAALHEWTGRRPQIVSLHPNCLADIFVDIGTVAQALGVPDRGRQLVVELKSRMAETADRARTVAPKPAPKVAVIEWIAPLMAAGNWIPELLSMLGAVSIFGQPGVHSPWMSMDELVAADPDVILVSPCGFDLAKTESEMPILEADPRWKSLRAVTQGRVALIDGNQFMNRPGPRIVETLQILAEAIFPQVFSPQHLGKGWLPR